MGNPCQDETILSAYMDGELSQDHAQSVRRHVAGCDLCRQRLAELKTADAMIQGMRVVEPSADFDRTFWRKVDQLETHDSGRWWTRWLYPVWRPALATGLAAGMAIAVFILTGSDNGVGIEERFIAENIEMLDDYDLLQHLEILENWDAMDAMKELS